MNPDQPTSETAPLMHASANESIEAVFRQGCQLERELAEIKAVLADPLAVHLNMLRGTIQWTPANLRHLLGQ